MATAPDQPVIRLPHNIDAEAALLGGLMTDNRWVDPICEILTPDDFYEPVHGRIFSAIVSECARGGFADPVSLKPVMVDDPGLKQLGGVGYLGQLTGSGAAVLGMRAFALQIAELAKRRNLIHAMQKTIERAMDTAEHEPIDALVEHIDQTMATSLQRQNTTRSVRFEDAFDKTLEALEDEASGKVVPGISVAGFNDWNRVTGVMRPGEVIVLAGRPSMGKTAVGIKVALASAQAGHGTLLISLEMTIEEITKRAIADILFVPGQSSNFESVKRGDFGAFDRQRLSEAREAMASWPLIMTDPSELRIARLAMTIHRYQRQMAARGEALKTVVIDYLGLIKGPPGRDKRYEEMGVISRTIKQVAKECGVAIVLLAQLNRQVEQRENKRPQLSDLRDSGDIEQDADVVVFVFREEYYLERSEPPEGDKARTGWEQQMHAAKDRVELICGKLRQGKITTRKCWFLSANQSVRDSDFYSKGEF